MCVLKGKNCLFLKGTESVSAPGQKCVCVCERGRGRGGGENENTHTAHD